MTDLLKINSGWDAISELDIEDLGEAVNDTRETITAFTALANLAVRLGDLAERNSGADNHQSADVIDNKVHSLWRAIRHMPVDTLIFVRAGHGSGIV